MKTNWQFYTPEGMADLLPKQAAEKRRLESLLREYFNSFAYQEIVTPAVEFFDVYAAGALAPQEALFKLCDERGRVLALRFDGTVPALRLAATKFADEAFPLRLSYIQSMYRFNESGGGRQREFTQAGVELLGLETAEADAEVIALAIGAARALGLNDLQLAIGQTAFLRALFDAWALSDEAREELSKLINDKNMLGVEAVARANGLDAAAYSLLSEFFDQPLNDEELERLQAETLPDAARKELNVLLDVLKLLRQWGLGDYVTADLSLLQSMDYYSGLCFKGFTYDLGFPLLSGGRYDRASSVFGKNFKATGFSLGVDFAQMALERQGIAAAPLKPKLLLAAAEIDGAELWQRCEALRTQGYACELCYNLRTAADLRALALRHGVDFAAFVEADGDVTYMTPGKAADETQGAEK